MAVTFVNGVGHEFGEGEIKSFLTDLAVEGNVAASTQDQAKSALLFLYQQVLNRELAFLDVSRSTKPQRLPVVLSRAEITKLLPEFSDLKRWDDVVFEFCDVSAVAGLELSFVPAGEGEVETTDSRCLCWAIAFGGGAKIQWQLEQLGQLFYSGRCRRVACPAG